MVVVLLLQFHDDLSVLLQFHVDVVLHIDELVLSGSVFLSEGGHLLRQLLLDQFDCHREP